MPRIDTPLAQAILNAISAHSFTVPRSAPHVEEQNLPSRLVKAVHGIRPVQPDPAFQAEMAQSLRETYSRGALLEHYGRFAAGFGEFDALMRRILFRALVRQCGDGLRIETNVGFKHPETFEIASGVFIGSQAYLQGRFDGIFRIGNRVWIGPQAYFDARALVIGDDVGWGPGAKVLGSAHTGLPADVPIIQTDLEIKPVTIGAGADIGVNAVILPGVTIGAGSVVGAGAVVTQDVEPYSMVAGVPARFLRSRREP
jgi:acetyltransferase-like isoleucine patch superfamily enzyme